MLNMPMGGAPKGGVEWASPSSSKNSDSWSDSSVEEEEDEDEEEEGSGFTGLNSRSVQEPKPGLIPHPGTRDWDRRSPLHSVYKKPLSVIDSQHASHPIAGHENRPYSRDLKKIRQNKGAGSIRDVKAKPREEEWPKDKKDHVNREGQSGGEKDIVDKITQKKCKALEQKKSSEPWINMERESKRRKRERDGDLVEVMPGKRSWGYDKESDEDDVDEDGMNRERDAFSYGVQNHNRTLCPRGNTQVANRYGHLKSCGQDGEGSQGFSTVYKADECMQELTRLRKEYGSSQTNKNSDRLFDDPALEIGIPAEHITATNSEYNTHAGFQCDSEDANETSFVSEEHSQDDIDSFFQRVELPSWKVPKGVRGQCGSRTVQFRREDASRDSYWKVRYPVNGGPLDIRVIRSIGGHVAIRIWEGCERGVLKCQNREQVAQTLCKWQRKLSPASQDRIRRTGLYGVPYCMADAIDWPLISAFVERWQPDTNSFHLPFGEMTILMHDVWQILRIPIEGQLLVNIGRDKCLKSSIAEELGVDDREALNLFEGSGVQSEALITHCQSRDEEAQIAAILSLTLGCCLFPDKSGSEIPLREFIFSDWVDYVLPGTSWGSATLACLYRQLGMASRDGCREIAGCLTLLQCWIYEYFPIFRPHCHKLLFDSSTPRAQMWSVRAESKQESRLVAFRAQLDRLKATEVNWMPYGIDPASVVPRTLYMGTICYRDIIEPYMPQRCLRQLGRRQVIPQPPIEPEYALRPARGKYKVQFPASALQWAWKTFPVFSVIPLDQYVRTSPSQPDSVDPEYMPWYQLHSHPILQKHGLYQTQRLPPVTATEEWMTQAFSVINDLIIHGAKGLDPHFYRAYLDVLELEKRWLRAVELRDQEEEDDSE